MQIILYNIYNLITWDIWLEEIQDLTKSRCMKRKEVYISFKI